MKTLSKSFAIQSRSFCGDSHFLSVKQFAIYCWLVPIMVIGCNYGRADDSLRSPSPHGILATPDGNSIIAFSLGTADVPHNRHDVILCPEKIDDKVIEDNMIYNNK